MKCETCVKESNERINTQRFITKLDRYFAANDLKGAGEHLSYWEKEAREIGDICGLLTVLNEEIGYSRRIGDREMAMNSAAEAREILLERGLLNNPSGAVICINIATTLKAFGKPEEGLPLYDLAEEVYRSGNLQKTYEFAALLNNRATALSDLSRFDEAEAQMLLAMEILKEEGNHDGEIAVTLINLAHLIYDRNQEDTDRVEETLDLAWDYINSPRQPHDANYAYLLSKIAPSLRYFNREEEAQALEEVAGEIYQGDD